MYVRLGRFANEEDSEDFERDEDIVIHPMILGIWITH